jgi:prepilin-type N-terminal cleavage/methylation domain-containing protein
MNSNSGKCEVRNAECGINSALRAPHSALVARRAFTLTELLIVIVIIGIITGLGLSAFAGAVELAREQRTRSIIAKIDQLIMERYESYRTRAVPLRTPPGTTPRVAAQNRLYALRELMRLEMPDRISDICYSGTSGTGEVGDQSDGILNAIGNANAADYILLKSVPSLTCSYRRSAKRSMSSTGWTTTHQSSECLYLILSTITDGDKNALDYLSSDEIGDTDDDGMKEILDAWGRPIQFLRWAPGYVTSNPSVGEVTRQVADSSTYPDPFDPIKVDPRWPSGTASTTPYALHPLLFSAGRNKVYDIDLTTVVSQNQTLKNDPYNSFTSPLAGQPSDFDSDGDDSRDNITNHNLNPPSP